MNIIKNLSNQPEYVSSTFNDLLSTTALPATYISNTESKIIRIVKQILAILIFPIGIYYLLHSLVGKIIVPASSSMISGKSSNDLDELRTSLNLLGDRKYKRFTIEVDGYQIDAMIMGKESTLGNGRWVLDSTGNCGFYEDKLHDHTFWHFLGHLDSNAIVFNYPGVGASTGWPNKNAMTKAYQAILRFLEDKENGIGAQEIIGYGFSIGGGVQGEALKTHPLQSHIKYVFVKRQTFSDLEAVVSDFTIKPLGWLVQGLGWNLGSLESSKKLQAPEVILQTGDDKSNNLYPKLRDSSSITHDKVISKTASLAKALLDGEHRRNKLFLGMLEDHHENLVDPAWLARQIIQFGKLTPFL